MWPKREFYWITGDTLFVSIPFTWNLPTVRALLEQKSMVWNKAVVGGPAIKLMPDYLSGLNNVTIGDDIPGVLQRINPLATRTTTGCIRSCKFCGIGQGRIERGGFKELEDWPDLPIICDNNLLASSLTHFDRVMDRLEKHIGVDFNQGLDFRKLTDHHATRMARLKSPSIRLSLDTISECEEWLLTWTVLRCKGVHKTHISSYALIGFDSSPDEAWNRCEWIQKFCLCLPMWFHDLDCLEWNQVTPQQAEMGWTNKERTRIMRRFYKAKYGGYSNSACDGVSH